jgi:hypothetical protein
MMDWRRVDEKEKDWKRVVEPVGIGKCGAEKRPAALSESQAEL